MTTTLLHNGLSRRGFLKGLGGMMATAAAMPLGLPGLGKTAVSTQIPIPPSLMLHSNDGQPQFLPILLEMLNEQGFTAMTYQGWFERVAQKRMPQKPVILSIDDISMAAQGCSAFATFVQMKEWIRAAGMTAVFGVITEPIINGRAQREQDEARWDLMADWVGEGFELATHTSYHSNFNGRDSGPRPDFTAVDYEAEIVRSAKLIETQLGHRNVPYRVKTIIMPYGSGYSYKLTPSQIHPGIIQACSQTDISCVVGIAQGRKPLSRFSLLEPQQACYVGRIPPAYLNDTNKNQPYADLTLGWLNAWYQNNLAYEIAAKPNDLI